MSRSIWAFSRASADRGVGARGREAAGGEGLRGMVDGEGRLSWWGVGFGGGGGLGKDAGAGAGAGARCVGSEVEVGAGSGCSRTTFAAPPVGRRISGCGGGGGGGEVGGFMDPRLYTWSRILLPVAGAAVGFSGGAAELGVAVVDLVRGAALAGGDVVGAALEGGFVADLFAVFVFAAFFGAASFFADAVFVFVLACLTPGFVSTAAVSSTTFLGRPRFLGAGATGVSSMVWDAWVECQFLVGVTGWMVQDSAAMMGDGEVQDGGVSLDAMGD